LQSRTGEQDAQQIKYQAYKWILPSVENARQIFYCFCRDVPGLENRNANLQYLMPSPDKSAFRKLAS
jgi:hypothetical protein